MRDFCVVFTGPDDKQYYFRDHLVFIVDGNKVKSIHRKIIFPGSPYFVNAMVYSHETGKAYLFKGKWLFKYSLFRFQSFPLVDSLLLFMFGIYLSIYLSKQNILLKF